MTDPVDPLTAAAARARAAADAHRGVPSDTWTAGVAEPGGPHRPGTPRTSAADVLSGRDDAHTVSSGADSRPDERIRDRAEPGD